MRERVEDIPVIVDALIKKVSGNPYIEISGISPRALEYIKKYHWPGNVRELENVIEHAANFVDEGGLIQTKHLPSNVTGIAETSYSKGLKEMLAEVERQAIIDALIKQGGSRTKAAKVLGLSRTSLYEKMEKYDIRFD